LFGFLINVDASSILPLGLAMILGSLFLSLLAALGAAITVGLRRGGLLVSLLILPFYVPCLIFGVAASSDSELVGPSLLILTALALAAVVLVPVAAAAALRAYLK
jgi:heme exporter protein B